MRFLLLNLMQLYSKVGIYNAIGNTQQHLLNYFLLYSLIRDSCISFTKNPDGMQRVSKRYITAGILIISKNFYQIQLSFYNKATRNSSIVRKRRFLSPFIIIISRYEIINLISTHIWKNQVIYLVSCFILQVPQMPFCVF